MTDVGGRTTKQTYVTKYTTDVDPRTLPDFASRGVVTDNDGWQRSQDRQPPQHSRQHRRHSGLTSYSSAPNPSRGRGPAAVEPPRHPHTPSDSASPTSSATDSVDEATTGTITSDGHRLRKKYTTTTVTTITTTTILLPKMQEAYVFPPMTSHQMEQQQQGRVYQVESGHTSASASPDRQRQLQPSNTRLVPSQPQYGPDGNGTQTWVFNQQSTNQVTTEESRGRLPTLEELGITSYFANDKPSQRQRRAAPYAPAAAGQRSNGQSPQQPWVAAETRHEVEGGKRYY